MEKFVPPTNLADLGISDKSFLGDTYSQIAETPPVSPSSKTSWELSQEIRESLKKLFPGQELYVFKQADGKRPYVYRTLNHEDFISIVRDIRAREGNHAQNRDDQHYLVFDKCVIWPSEVKNLSSELRNSLPVGDIPSVANAIMQNSGFTGIDLLGNILGKELFSTKIREADTWPMLSPEEKETLIAKHNSLLSLAVIDKWSFVVRPTTRADLSVIMTHDDKDFATCQINTVWPETIEWTNIPYGVIQSLSTHIESISGWQPNVEIEEL